MPLLFLLQNIYNMIIRIAFIIVLSFVLLLHSSFLSYSNEEIIIKPDIDPPFLQADSAWVDSVFNTMTEDERIAQLIMYPAYSNKDEKEYSYLEKLIREYKIGGLIFMQGGPVRQANLTNRYQDASDIPLLIASDAEWGLAMRLDSTISYPRQMMMGAITEEDIIYEFGKTIANECKRIGVHVNFAPVIDVNNNSANPVIGYRSFGEDKRNVSRKGFYYMKGMQDQHVLAVGKHFPGHGDTDTDSHLSLPIIKHSKERIDSLELYPFKQLIDQGLGGMMVAHLYIPSLDSTKNLATTLSPKVVDQLLKNKLNYKGLIFTDALNMGGVSKYFSPGEVDVKALLAGNDILLFPASIPKAIEMIRQAVDNGEISQEEIDQRCKKLLKVKYWAGLNNYKSVEISNIANDLNSEESELVRRKLIENAITVVKNDDILPFYDIDSLSIAVVAIGDQKGNEFQKQLDMYFEADQYSVAKQISSADKVSMIKKLSEYDVVIISFHKPSRRPKSKYGIKLESIKFAEELAQKTDVVIDVFANPYSLTFFNDLDVFKSVIVSYNDWTITQNISAQVLFGGIPAKGRLPVSVSEKYRAGDGVGLDKKIRLKYSIPEEVGVDSKKLEKIDSLANDAISAKATPGCQILVAKDGAVIFHKAYGYHTYDKKQKVQLKDIYDLASITKVAATTSAIMKLYDENKCDIDSSLSTYLPYLFETDKKDILIKDVMLHNARLKPWIPFYLRTVKNDSIFNITYRKAPDTLYSVQVSKDLFIRHDYRDTIFRRIAESKLRQKKEYKYSDIGYYWLYDLTEKITDMPFEEFLDKNIYQHLGAKTMCFNPLNKYNNTRIVPTERETYFRNDLVDGYVHDMGAAMLGGVCGHAGLFSNANDLAKLMQMFLQGGEYGGKRYFSNAVVDTFNQCYYCPDSRRGIGFDKPEMNYDKVGPTCQCVSAESFGHSGFTGTLAWADPKEQIVYIFLSNRTYPDMNNKKLLEMDVRTNIQEVIYNSIINKQND
jgi:beta-N-acetylhexosaminidase